VASYLGLIPREHFSGRRQKLRAITKHGNRMMQILLVEGAQIAVRYDPEFRRQYLHRCHGKPKAVAKVAVARKLAVRLYWMLRTQKPILRNHSRLRGRNNPTGSSSHCGGTGIRLAVSQGLALSYSDRPSNKSQTQPYRMPRSASAPQGHFRNRGIDYREVPYNVVNVENLVPFCEVQ
jgi:hypothetical protein